MSELEHEGQSEPRRYSRRDILRWGVGGGVAITMATGATLGAKPLFEAYERKLGREDVQSVFEDILKSSHKFMIYDGLLQIDSRAKIAQSVFGHPSSRPELSGSGFVVAERPIAVHGTLLRNIADYSGSTQGHVDRILPAIPPRLMAFYDPNESGSMFYLDADVNGGLIVPLSASAPSTIEFQHLPVSDINIQGRELRGEQVYPYTKSVYTDRNNGQPVEDYSFIGQSATASNTDELNYMASRFFYGKDAVTLPPA